MLSPAIPADRCTVVIAERQARDPAEEREIDAAWRTIKAAEPRLFDGALVSVRELRVDGRDVRIEAEVAGYRDFVVQRETPLDLGVRPLGVTGLTRAGDGVLLGRRSRRVTQYPGLWEPVPAGSVSPSASATMLEDQLLAELAEEAGIGRDEVTAIAVAGVVVDEADAVVDVCFALTVPEAAGRRAAGEHRSPDEHDELRLCSLDAARELARDAAAAVPTMGPMLMLALGERHTG